MASIAALTYTGPVLADSVWCEGVKVASDVTFELPEISPEEAELQAMGTFNLPIYTRLDDMECKITKIGQDTGFGRLIKEGFTSKTLEFRWATETLDKAGVTKVTGCRAYITGYPKGVPAISVEPGESTENEITFSVWRYRLVAGADEMIKVDRLTEDCKINGVDLTAPVKAIVG